MAPRSTALSPRTLGGALAAVVVALVLGWQGLGGPAGPDGSADPVAPATSAPSGPSESSESSEPSGSSVPAGYPVVALADLPPEAVDTVALIDSGGPYPYDQDDSVFGNREGLLPDRPDGYYREYTVPTPGSEDRGARRIVAGADGELFWTADHYESFAVIDRDG